MRIKSFTARSVSEAMNMVRLELGDDAIILSTQNLPSGEAQITAALEQKEEAPRVTLTEDDWARDWANEWDSDWKEPSARVAPKPTAQVSQAAAPRILRKESRPNFGNAAGTASPVTGKMNGQANGSQPKPAKPAPTKTAPQEEIRVTPKMDLLVQAMAYHGIPTLLAERICRTALSVDTDDPTMALAASLDKHFNYSPSFSRRNTPLMLVGPPGVGKTMTIAKMAASARMSDRKVHVISTDTSKAGAIAQLKSFTDILGLKLWIAENPDNLADIISRSEMKDGSHILIDTGGINSYDQNEIKDLARYILAARAEIIAVLAAGTDSAEMSDTAEKFATIGARRLLVTRLDTTRRYGGIFTAADNANLSFSYASVSSSVATGLHTINPVNLARLILRDPTLSDIGNEFDKAKR
ncbi:AAA family ATPase [Sneathiella chinensis]|uniref:Flagella-associated GTP-binding protein n=1 Tax=Sneathiella chinensis TaxID=349750 RepID=A0ABQ5U3I6_9PROT|nr:AAA family ATPase [Sneathiella chinensis]GLQ05844.1 hypothetical protein GCM10007924_10650 [Sneathiella chinensis]